MATFSINNSIRLTVVFKAMPDEILANRLTILEAYFRIIVNWFHSQV